MKDVLHRHAQALWLAAFLLVAGGLFAATRMPVSLFPHIDFPRVVVAIDAGDRDAGAMTAEITRPIEIALRAVPGVSRVRSTTSRGSAEVAMDFPWSQDMVTATLATQTALATVLPDLPAGTRFDVRRSDPTIFPVLGIALTSDSLDQNALRQIAELTIRPALTAVPGVAGIDILGGAPREIAVDVDPARAQALGLSLDAIATTIGKANAVRGVGRLEDRHRLYLVLSERRIATIADLAATPVKAASGSGSGAGVVTLGQIATIHPAIEPAFTKVSSGGHDAVLVNVRQSLTGDTVRIVADVDARLAQLGLPPSVKVTPFYDQSELVTGAANAVRDAILIGSVLAGLVLFAFLRSVRLMIITGLMLPAVLAATCLILGALGMSFNMMTLGGMAAAVGLVVDDAVVMLEHIMRRLQEGGTSVGRAAAEMSHPLIGSTAATIVVFTPLAFVSGVTGGFFKALALTMVAALGLSLLFARCVLPLLAERWVRPRDVAAAERAGAFQARLARWNDGAARRALARPGLFVGVVGVALAVLGYAAWTQVPSGFMPAMDEGGFILDYKAQAGAALGDTDRLLRQVEQIITATPEVASYSRRTGAQLGGGLTEADEGDLFIRLKGGSRRPIEEVMADIRNQIGAKVPGLEIETAQLMEDLIGDLTAVPQPIEVKLFGDDPKLLSASARRVGTTIGKILGIVEVVDGLRLAGDALAIKVDAAAALQQGLDPDAVATQVEALVAGTPATQLRIGEQLVTARVRAAAALRSRADLLARLPLTAPDGHLVRLGQIARVDVAAGQTQINPRGSCAIRRGHRTAGGPRSRVGHEGRPRCRYAVAPAGVSAGRIWRPLRTAAAELCRSHDGVPRCTAAERTAADGPVRSAELDTCGDRHRTAVSSGGAGRTLGNGDRTRHFGTDGADDGGRHGDRARNLLPRRTAPGRPGGRRRAARGGRQAFEADPDVGADRSADAGAARARAVARCGAAAPARHRNHLRVERGSAARVGVPPHADARADAAARNRRMKAYARRLSKSFRPGRSEAPARRMEQSEPDVPIPPAIQKPRSERSPSTTYCRSGPVNLLKFLPKTGFRKPLAF